MRFLASLSARIGSSWGRFLLFALNPRLGRSLQRPLASTYYSFGHMLAQVFCSLKLIERSHPWMRAGMKLRPLEVLSYAWARTNWKKPWEPVPVFVSSISLLLLFGLFSFSTFAIGGAFSATNAYATSLFTSPSEPTDLALRTMSDAFGLEIGTNVPLAPATNGQVDAVVEGFQEMMGLYSMAMLVVAGFILLYIILTSIAATAHKGRFGGGSFNQVWAPIRLVVAIGLLIPLPLNGISSYNSGQYIVLKLAEWGSGLGTNLWVPFATSLAEKQDVMAMPDIQPAASVVRGVLLNEFCAARYQFVKNSANISDDQAPQIERLLKVEGIMRRIAYTPFGDATTNFCGTTTYMMPTEGSAFALNIYRDYEAAYLNMRDKIEPLAAEISETLENSALLGVGQQIEDKIMELLITGSGAESFISIINEYQQDLAQAVDNSQSVQVTSASDALTTEVEERGWAGASLWFNTIARLNAELMEAATALPISRAPDYQNAAGVTADIPVSISTDLKKSLDVLSSYLNGLPARVVDFGYDENYGVYTIGDVKTPSVLAGLEGVATAIQENSSLDILSSKIAEILTETFGTGLGGPFDSMGTGIDTQLDRNNPLADLAKIGDWMIRRSFILYGVAQAIPGSLLTFLALAGATTGLVLFYVLPLLPFIRFTFGFLGWMLNILEAVIAIPLVAVAHLTTRGEGVSGDLARTAYFSIFGAFLRPALLIVGMIIALMTFSIAIDTLNELYRWAVIGYRGESANQAYGGLSVIMYTVLYTVIAYMLCNLCFHLIEEVPNRAMTWINQAASRDITQDERVVSSISQAGDNIIYTPMKSIGIRPSWTKP